MEGIVSLVLLLVGIVAIYFGNQARKSAKLILDTPTTKCDKIRTAGFYEVNGVVKCEQPVILPNWDTECVWYHILVEEQIRTKQSDGPSRTRWRTVDEQTNRCAFQVSDKSGSIWVNCVGAEIEASEKQHDQAKSAGIMSALFARDHVTGERITVKYLQVGTPVYVLGRVKNLDGSLCFVEGGESFIISNKTEEEVLGSKETYMYAGIGGGVVALIGSLISFLMFMRTP